MPDMYDKLGDMLNEALKSGKIPQNTTKTEEEPAAPDLGQKQESTGYSSVFFNNSQKSSEKNRKSAKTASKKAIPTGEVIKLHKYTYNMQFPPHIQKALSTLDIVYPFSAKDISKKYRKLLKENHPDTQNTIQSSENVDNIRHYSVDEIVSAYRILCSYFGIKY